MRSRSSSVNRNRQCGDGGQQQVGLAQRPVGEPGPQPVAGVPGLVAVVVSQPERGRDQGGVVLDVRAHDQHVARFERRIVSEQADEHLAEHFDLPFRAVAGVDLQGSVGGIQARPGLAGRLDRVVLQRPLQPPEQRCWTCRQRVVKVIDGLSAGRYP
jgi:hypothetical protein